MRADIFDVDRVELNVLKERHHNSDGMRCFQTASALGGGLKKDWVGILLFYRSPALRSYDDGSFSHPCTVYPLCPPNEDDGFPSRPGHDCKTFTTAWSAAAL